MSLPPVPFVQIERSRSSSPITQLPTSGSDSERSESPRTVLPDRDNGATAATIRTRGERTDSDSSSSQCPDTEHEFSVYSTDSSNSTYIVSIRETKGHASNKPKESPLINSSRSSHKLETTSPEQYVSSELRSTIPKQKLTEISHKKRSAYENKFTIKSKGKEIVKGRVWINPKVRLKDEHKDIALLHIEVTVSRDLMKRIRESDEICSIQLDAQIMYNRERLNMSYHPRSADIHDGSVAFDQELVSCDELASPTIKKVDLIATATLTIRPRVLLKCQSTEEDFVAIHPTSLSTTHDANTAQDSAYVSNGH